MIEHYEINNRDVLLIKDKISLSRDNKENNSIILNTGSIGRLAYFKDSDSVNNPIEILIKVFNSLLDIPEIRNDKEILTQLLSENHLYDFLGINKNVNSTILSNIRKINKRKVIASTEFINLFDGVIEFRIITLSNKSYKDNIEYVLSCSSYLKDLKYNMTVSLNNIVCCDTSMKQIYDLYEKDYDISVFIENLVKYIMYYYKYYNT